MRFNAVTTYTVVLTNLESELYDALEDLDYEPWGFDPSPSRPNPRFVYKQDGVESRVTFGQNDTITIHRTREDGMEFKAEFNLSSPMMVQLIHSICHNLKYPEF